MNQTAQAYLAALIDSEGNIGICRQAARGKKEFPFQYFPRLMISNSHLALLKLAQHLMGGSGYVCRYKARPDKPNWSAVHRLTVNSNRCREVLADILPFLVLKRAQADIILRFPRRHNRSRNRQEVYRQQEALFAEMARLNQRGAKASPVTEVPADHPLFT